jgi:hypothetical protein
MFLGNKQSHNCWHYSRQSWNKEYKLHIKIFIMKKLFFVSAAALLSASVFAAPVYSINATRIEVLQEKKEIKVVDLPQAVKNTIAADYKEWIISKAYVFEATTEYEVEFTKEGQTKTVKFDKNGNVIA